MSTDVRPPVFVHWRLRAPDGCRDGELPDADVLRVAAEIVGCGAMVLAVDGCDPLVRDCCLPVVERAAAAGVLVAPSLQGRAAAAARLGAVLAARPHSVSLRIFAPSAAGHDAVVGEPGAFDRVRAAARAARAAGVRSVLTVSPLTGEPRVLADAVDLARELAVTAFDVVPALASDGVPAARLPGAGVLDPLYAWLGVEGAQRLGDVELVRNKHGAPPGADGCSAHAALAKISAAGVLLACGDSDRFGIDLRTARFDVAWARLRSARPVPPG